MGSDHRFISKDRHAHHRIERIELPGALDEIASALQNEPYVFLLDSSAGDLDRGRFSFLAVRPRFVLRVQRTGAGARVRIDHLNDPVGVGGEPREFDTSDPFDVIRQALRAVRLPDPSGSEAGLRNPVPFIGGLIGYVGYEMLHFVEEIPDGPDALDLPDLVLAACDTVVAFDYQTGRAFLSVIGRGPTEATARGRAGELLNELAELVTSARLGCSLEGEWYTDCAPVGSGWSSRLPRGAYLRSVKEILGRIAAGDLYQMNLTRRVSRPFAGSAGELYARLRRANPAPFGAYFKLPEAHVLSCSPERFLRMDSQGRVETRPMKGTRPRGDDPQQDDRLAEELYHSSKDRAEHTMIVDLLRNDLGRVCEFGTVRVPEVMIVERHATVLQMVSTIVGRLREGLDVVDLLGAAFPGGSMTGAPKVAAMKLISRLEPVGRGVYSGCLGYLDARGGCDLNIVIRTVILRSGRAHVHAGGAIVADSDPQAEFEEACLKAGVLMRAVDSACRRIGETAPVS